MANKHHNMSATRTYKSWQAMKERCLSNKSTGYKYYGMIGITVCESWLSFKCFFSDMGERPLNKTLDRIDSKGNYEPSNCRWATPLEQVNNRREIKKGKLKGVEKRGNRFRAYITINRKRLNLGSFSTSKEAGQAYEDAYFKHYNANSFNAGLLKSIN